MLTRAPAGAGTESPSEPARVIDGRYEVVRELGRGGMGVVYQVFDRATQRDLALKQLLSADVVSTTGQRERSTVRFRREFHTVAGLSHPCVVTVYEYGIELDQPYYTMELLEGPTLSQLLRAPVTQCCRILRGVASALAFLHSRRLLHRDLKTRNVRCDASGRPKLLDFGILATMGVAGDVAGTPPCIPPEALWGLPLDARSDLFGLGALGYRLVTGKQAYPAKTLEELEEHWQRRPTLPSRMREDIPPALDDLLLALLSVEPEGRPSTAAEVIARLDVIGGLERAPELDVARGWLQSARLVGREQELETIRGTVEDASQGVGSMLVVHGPSGVGKTRLLREAGLHAQLSGATVLRGRGRGTRHAPYDLVRQLVRDMWRVCPNEAAASGGRHAPVLRRVIPELRRGRESQSSAVHAPPAEERLRLQESLLEWFLELAKRRPIIILVDDLECCDEGSATLLASLGHVAPRHALAVLGARRTETAAGTRRGWWTGVGESLRLSELDRAAVSELVRDWFGELPGAPELAEWIHRAAGGSPMHCSELARHLVEEGIVLYTDGIWRQVADPEDAQPPDRMTEAMDLRVEALSVVGRAMGQALALWRGPAPVELCAELLQTGELGLVFEALDELVYEEIIVGGDEGFELVHDGIRDALLRVLEPDRRRLIHEITAELIVDRWGQEGGDRQADLGWHLLRAGRRRDGAQLLERAGRRRYALRSFEDAVDLLEAALQVYLEDDEPGDEVRALELQSMLVRAGVIGDRAAVVRYAEVTIEAFARRSGLPLARRLARWTGRRIGLAAGLAWASVGWLLRGRAHRGPSPRNALATTVALTNYVATVYAMAFDVDRVMALRQGVDVVRGVRNSAAEAASAMLDGLVALSTGSWREAHQKLIAVDAAILASEPASMSEMDRRMFCGGARVLKLVIEAVEQDGAFEESLDTLTAMKMRFFSLGAQMSRVYFHRLRGEEEQARGVQRDADLSVVQLGNAWTFESLRAWVSAFAHGLTGDVVGLRRAADELERLDRAGLRLGPFVAAAQADLELLHDHPQPARESLAAALAELPPSQRLARLVLRASQVASLVALGCFREAIEAAERALEEAPAGTGPGAARVRVRCGLAVALARTDRFSQAHRELDALIVEVAEFDNPMLMGLVRETGAEIAAAGGDDQAQRRHAASAELLFASTGNPVLIARARRLVAALPESTLPEAGADEDDDGLESDTFETVDLRPLK
ncbi:MAG: AAA family ATPase [Myxococcota bacterium]